MIIHLTYNLGRLLCSAAVTIAAIAATAQPAKKVVYFDATTPYQTIENFGASDAWACQFVGNWPEAKKNAIADWLFSTDTLQDGSPKGIGLSMWRYNFGAGSAEQKDGSGIKDEWRRAALSTGSDPKVAAQNWFLQAAQKRGVQQFLGFFNSPPVQFTKNGKAFAEKGRTNIDTAQYPVFATYAAAAIRHLGQQTGVHLDYLSPFNEPQWDWSDGGQEGCPYNNEEISNITKAFSAAFTQANITTKILVSESGHHKYLLADDDKPNKGNQIANFFNPASPYYIGALPNVSPIIASHSYFSTAPMDSGLALRKQLQQRVTQHKGLQLWQSEYCILGDNNGEINGNKRDLGMKAALYLSKVLYQDLVAAKATAWHWWTALSAYDYKDGLVYLDKKEQDGNFSDSKMMWVLGNYSFFVRPGMQRIEATTSEKELYVTAFTNNSGKSVIIISNPTNHPKSIVLQKRKGGVVKQALKRYTTDANSNLHKTTVAPGNLIIGPESVVSIVVE